MRSLEFLQIGFFSTDSNYQDCCLTVLSKIKSTIIRLTGKKITLLLSSFAERASADKLEAYGHLVL